MNLSTQSQIWKATILDDCTATRLITVISRVRSGGQCSRPRLGVAKSSESLCLRLQVFLKWNAVYKFRLSHQQCSRLFINTKLSCDTVSGSAVKVGFTARPLSTPRLSEKSRGASGDLKICLQDSMDDCFSRPKEPLCSIFILTFLLRSEFGVKHDFSSLYKTGRHPAQYVCQPRLGLRPHSPAPWIHHHRPSA